MKHGFTKGIIGLFFLLAFAGCTKPSQENVTSDQQSIKSVSVPSSSSASSNEMFRYTDQGYRGVLVVKGYAVVDQKKDEGPDPDYGCAKTGNCPSYQYVYFHITDDITEALSSFLQKNHGNAFLKDDAIGLGCLSKGTISASSPDGTSAVNESMTKVLLQSTKKNPVALTLVRTVEPIGGGAPHCWSHFTFVSVTR